MDLSPTRRGPSTLLILLALCLGAGAGWYYRQNTATKEQQQFLGTINQMSNVCHAALVKLNEQKLVNLSLERDLSIAVENAVSYSNQVSTLAVASAKANVAKEIAAAAAHQPDPKVTQLQEERDGFATKLTDLNSAIAKLDKQMAEAQRKLLASEGDREALLQELKQIEADRAKLLQQFNDLALVREQLRKLKAEQSVSHRLESIRRGMYGSSKGGELLRKGMVSTGPASENYDLNVEIRRSH